MDRPPQVIDRVDLRRRAIPGAPVRFRGIRTEYISRYLEPLLPDVRAVEDFHRALVEYLLRPDPELLIRAVAGLERGEVVRTRDGTALKPTDNAPAWWWHAVLFNGVPITSARFPTLVAGTPCRMFDIGSVPTINGAGWHAAHILDVKDGNIDWRGWDRVGATWRFVRNVHPCNVFYVPTKPDWQRVGGDHALIASVAGFYRERYAAVWEEFTRLAGASSTFGLDAPDGGLQFAPVDSEIITPARPVSLAPDSGLRGQLPPSRHAPALQRAGGPAIHTGGRWAEILRVGSPPPVGVLLMSHPDAGSRTRRLLTGLTVQRLISIADALHNKCRPTDMRVAVPDDRLRQADLSWRALFDGAEKVHRPPTGWTATIDILQGGSAEGLAAVSVMDIGSVARVCANIVSGPYKDVCDAARR